MSSALESVWEELEGESLPGGMIARRVFPEAKSDLFVGVESPGAVRTFFLEVSRNAISGVSRWPSCAGFTVGAEPADQDKSRRRVVVRSRESRSGDLFATVAEDVLGLVAQQHDARETITALVGRLLRWQRFLENHGTTGLSINQQRGLFGELWVLEQFIVPNCGVVRAMDSWTGPLAKDHDFQLPELSCEVKTSASNPDHRVVISNVRQLDDVGCLNLVLLHISLIERNAHGRTLVDLVRDVRLICGEHLHRLNSLLIEAGYLDVQAAHYDSRGYVVQSHEAYKVRDGFPRLLERDLPAGVGEVSYSVSLGACTQYVLEQSELATMLSAGGT